MNHTQHASETVRDAQKQDNAANECLFLFIFLKSPVFIEAILRLCLSWLPVSEELLEQKWII